MVDLCNFLDIECIKDIKHITSENVNVNNDDNPSESSEDSSETSQIYNGATIIYDSIPVILRKRYSTWEVNLDDKNKLYLKWSVCDALLNGGINSVDAFKIKTLFGTQKQSMSERNGYKYTAPIKKWYVSFDDLCIFELEPIIFNGELTIFNVAVRYENCEMSRFMLDKHLTIYTNTLLCDADIQEIIEQDNLNVAFTRKLFNVK